MGIVSTATVRTPGALREVFDRTREQPGPWAIVAKVTESPPTTKPPLDCVYLKQRFMAAIGNPEPATAGAAT
jgi:hypothetical protein